MTTYARISRGIAGIPDGTVVEVVDLPDGQTPQTNYTPDIAAQFIECPATVQQWWTYSGGQWSPPK